MPRRYVPRALRTTKRSDERPRSAEARPAAPAKAERRPKPEPGVEPAVESVDTAEVAELVGAGSKPSPPPRRRPSPRPRLSSDVSTDAVDTVPAEAESESEVAAGEKPKKESGKPAKKAPVKAPARPGGSGSGRRTSTRPGKSGKPTKSGARRAREAARRRAVEQRRLRTLHTATLVLVILLVLGAGGVGVTWWFSHRNDAAAGASDAAMSAARDAVPALLSYDYKTYDAGVQNAASYAGGTFAGQYTKSMKELRPQAIKLKAVVTAAISTLGVVSASPDQVTVLVFVNQTRTNTNLSSAKVDQDRVVLTMQPIDGHWKVVKVIAV